MSETQPRLLLPDAPALIAGYARSAVMTRDGEILSAGNAEIPAILAGDAPLLIHAPASFRRLNLPEAPAYDLLTLFAFALPAQTATPTARGLALALDIEVPEGGAEAEIALLPTIATVLLRHLARARNLKLNKDAASLAVRMGEAGWRWAPMVLAAIGAEGAKASPRGLRAWQNLPQWEHNAPPPPPRHLTVTGTESRARLARLLGPHAEQRPGQADYADAASHAFTPREAEGAPQTVLAEAGTGTGKTLAYLAPATVWAERNQATVWISTYTRHLQRQIQHELARLLPDQAERRRRVVVRKGRENYLCLLRLDEATAAPAANAIIPLALIARWTLATDDGDLQGGDLPGWFGELFGAHTLPRLADKRGECLHGGCPHWRRCFVEHTIRRARTADLVIANHALVMTQAAMGGLDEIGVPSRYVFDEGHLLFEAADSAFAATLSGAEAAELRRWLLGNERPGRGPRGLRGRLETVIADRDDLTTPLDAALNAARALPPLDWANRAIDAEPGRLLAAAEAGPAPEPENANPTEAFLHALRRHVLASAESTANLRVFGGECDLFPHPPALAASAASLARALTRIVEPLTILCQRMAALLETEADTLPEEQRGTIEGMARAINRRALNPLMAWRGMLTALTAPGETPDPSHVLLARLERRQGETQDVALCRHWRDPTIPFALSLAQPAHGLLITSATLRDFGRDDPALAWQEAEARVGAQHLPAPALRVTVASPFDYAAQTRAFVVTDVDNATAALAGAYRALFEASGGGGLGLFTAIARLKAVHARIAGPLEAQGIPLLAQHVDAMDNATLVDIFRTEETACLLGTDAMRDGVDVPGNALRLVVFERVPWPRPDILHRERRVHLSGGEPRFYDDRIARLRLRQAFGRLIRRASDRGVFVLLDRLTPARLYSAFPAGVTVERMGLAEAVARTREFFWQA